MDGHFFGTVFPATIFGQPPGGFPAGIVNKVLKGEAPNTERPGKHLPPVDLEAKRQEVSD
ncbi:MAG: hypothetical protein ACPIA5_01465, partial [Flavobacteriales bacterium]